MQKFLPALFCLLLPLFSFTQPRYTVVIDEIMADPTPSAGLPLYEWIELKNTGASPILLQNWRIGDENGQSGPLPHFTLAPDSFVIVCSNSALPALSAIGTSIAVSNFPSLDNDGETLYLKTAGGMLMHAVQYRPAWYRSEVKQEGGWSLEMIDPGNPCGGAPNWTASTAASGGSPGRKNAAAGLVPDEQAPQLKRAYTSGPASVILVFDEPVDSLSGAAVSHYTISNGLQVLEALPQQPLFTGVKLTTSAPLAAGTIYTIAAGAVKDCRGNAATSNGQVKTGLPADPQAGDWVINEILFDPRPNGDDYVEFYNNSPKILDASRLSVAGRNSSGTLAGIQPLSTVPFFVLPGEYLAITTSIPGLALAYHVKDPGRVLELPSLPSLPDEEGTVVALNFQGQVVDEVHYRADWHFKLLDNREGIALERVDPAGNSQEAQNWHSAASTSGYGTPGYQNSQYRSLTPSGAAVLVSPTLFSPDNDGRDDLATIQYTLPAPGYVVSVTVFDARGKPVRRLVRNETAGLTGQWNWDGLGDNGNPLPVGTYIVLTELFNLQGKTGRFKHTIVLAGHLK